MKQIRLVQYISKDWGGNASKCLGVFEVTFLADGTPYEAQEVKFSGYPGDPDKIREALLRIKETATAIQVALTLPRIVTNQVLDAYNKHAPLLLMQDIPDEPEI